MSSFKKFSEAQSGQGDEKPADATKNALLKDTPAARPDKAPSENKDAVSE
jgi:hypothetical protein